MAVYDADPQSSASLWAAAAEQARRPATIRRAAGQLWPPSPTRAARRPQRNGRSSTRPSAKGPLLDKTLAVADCVIVPTFGLADGPPAGMGHARPRPTRHQGGPAAECASRANT
ncbi:MAG: hypothetical protein ACLTUO_04970 [Bifidobacterium sp.]